MDRGEAMREGERRRRRRGSASPRTIIVGAKLFLPLQDFSERKLSQLKHELAYNNIYSRASDRIKYHYKTLFGQRAYALSQNV